MKRKIFFTAIVAFGMMLNINAQTIEQAKKLLDQEQFSKAINVLAQMSKADASNAEIIYLMGKSYYQVGNDDSAIFFFKKAASVSPESPYGLISSGQISLSKKEYDNAKLNFDKAIAVTKSKNPGVIIEIGNAILDYAGASNDTSMFVYVNQIFAKGEKICKKSASFYLVKGDIEKIRMNGGPAMLLFKQAKEIEPTNPRILMKMADIYRSARSYEVAYGYYDEAQKMDPEYPPVYRELGEMNFLRGDFKQATDNYGKYINLIGNNLDAKIKYAKFLFLSKLYDKSIEVINDILKVDNTVVLYRLLAYSSYENKQYEEGLKAMEYFIKKQDESKLMQTDYTYYGRLLAKNKQDSMAYVILMKAYEKEPNDASLLVELLQVSISMKQYDKAIMWQNKRIANQTKFNLNDYTILASLSYRAEDYKSADSLYQYIMEKTNDTNNIEYTTWRARSLNGLDDTQKPKGFAMPMYKKVIDLGKADATKYKNELVEAYRYMGFYYFKKRNTASSKEMFRNVLKLIPNDPQAKDVISKIEKYEAAKKADRDRINQEAAEDASLDYLLK